MDQNKPKFAHSIIRIGLQIAIIGVIAFGAHMLIDWVMTKAETLSPNSQKLMLTSLVGALLLAYALLMATPFVPGIEIGLSLIILRGAPIVPFVFIATFSGLVLAYLVGRYMPRQWLQRTLSDLRLNRAANLLNDARQLTPAERVEMLQNQLPRWMGTRLVNWRYLVLAALINVPGNALIGGGGGICMVAGLSRIFTPWATLLTLAIAVSPFPLFVWFFGVEFLAG
jgi:hypothetical protein